MDSKFSSRYLGKFFTVDALDSEYFAVTGNEVERCRDSLGNTWIKLAFDFPLSYHRIQHIETWFKRSELIEETSYTSFV